MEDKQLNSKQIEKPICNKCYTESQLQSECFKWAWNELPKTRGLLCYNLNNSKNRIDGSRNKALGLIAGRSDMVFYWRGQAVMIEFKDPSKGRQSKKQKEWQKLIESHGFEYQIVKDIHTFKKIILNKINFFLDK